MTSLSSRQIERPALAPSSRLQGLRDGKLPRRLAIAALILLLAFLTLYPLSMLLYGSLHSTPPGMAGSFNLDGYRQILTWPTTVLFANTVGISFAKTIISLSLAVLLAWIFARTDTPAAARSKC